MPRLTSSGPPTSAIWTSAIRLKSPFSGLMGAEESSSLVRSTSKYPKGPKKEAKSLCIFAPYVATASSRVAAMPTILRMPVCSPSR